jgi:predicted phage terminase large subunit-like protein
MSTPNRPPGCTHVLTYPLCGCVYPPTLSTHLIVERDKKKAAVEAEKKKPKKPGRPKTTWTPQEDPADQFLEKLPQIVDDPYARANLLRMVDAELAKGSFAEFCQQAWHVVEPSTKLEWSWHHDLLCAVLQGVFEDWDAVRTGELPELKISNILVNIPPGTGKSKILSLMYPVWIWLRAPGTKFLCLSVNEDASLRDARDSRQLIRSDWFQSSFTPDWALNLDQTAISNYGNSKGGIRLSKAQGSEVVGLRADFLLIDDPNNPMESESKLVRESVNELWRTNIYNRVNSVSNSVRIGIQQRTHDEDWTGFVLKHQGVWSPENRFGWLHVCLPAEFEPERRCVTPWGSDPRTVKGQSLHEARMPRSFLEDEKKRFGSQKYAGQMQQRPTLAEGGTVKMKWWRFFHYANEKPLPQSDRKLGDEVDRQHPSKEVKKTHGYSNRWDFDWIVISVDPAAKRTERGSQHGLLVIAGKGPQRFILDDRTCRGDILDVLAIIEDLCRVYDPDRIIIEAKAAGPALMTLFEDRFQRGKILGSNGRPLSVVVDSIEPQGDKGQRLDAILPTIEAGLVYLHDGAKWLEPFVGEICAWPLGSNDDRIDSLSQCLNHMNTYSNSRLPSW